MEQRILPPEVEMIGSEGEWIDQGSGKSEQPWKDVDVLSSGMRGEVVKTARCGHLFKYWIVTNPTLATNHLNGDMISLQAQDPVASKSALDTLHALNTFCTT